ncbi:MAG: serine acetyltransferase [Sphingobacteriales bacterium]|nr:serine acetyltransferase [Sphingobacteriales bacterium]
MHHLHQWLLQLETDHRDISSAPSKRKAQHFIDELIAFLFPNDNHLPCTLPYLQIGLARLEVQLHELLLPLRSQLLSKIDDIVQHYFATLPIIYQTLKLDAQTILQFDPAAASMQEVVSAYPGFRAIAVYRLTHQLVGMGVPTLPRLLSEYAHSQTGIDIHPGATIGSAFFIDHGTGVVIGETTHIGNNVKIYQGVTLGALNVQKDLAQTKRHPTIEDNVIIYSGSTILGGNTVIGHSSIIGGNTWITETVPPYSLVYHKAEVRIRNKQVPYTHEIDFVI